MGGSDEKVMFQKRLERNTWISREEHSSRRNRRGRSGNGGPRCNVRSGASRDNEEAAVDGISQPPLSD